MASLPGQFVAPVLANCRHFALPPIIACGHSPPRNAIVSNVFPTAMSTIRPFQAFRPLPEVAAEIAAKPYDVLNTEEARQEVQGHPLSFLHIGKPEVDLDPSIDLHDPQVYEKGRDNLQKLISDEVLREDAAPSLYIYAQTMNGRTQYGILGCASVEEYWNDTIKKHEHTRKDKEEDRCNHVRVTNSHSGPIFLTYPDDPQIDQAVARIISGTPDNDHVAADDAGDRLVDLR